MRSNRRKRDDIEKEHFVETPPQNGAVRTEEGEKSTTYVIAAAQDSTVKVTVQQNKYESSMPATTVRPLGAAHRLYYKHFRIIIKNFKPQAVGIFRYR